MDALTSPTLRAHTAIQNRVTLIKARLDSVRIEAVTGKVADLARAVDGDIGKVNRMKQTLSYAEDRRSVLAFEGSRASIAQTVLDGIRAQTKGISNTVLNAISSAAPQSISVAQTYAQSAVEDTIGRLNTDFGGRPLFGGDRTGPPFGTATEMMTELRAIYTSATDTATALSEIHAWFNDPTGGFATTFFRGGNGEAPTVELSPGERIASSVKGDTAELRSALHAQSIAALSADAPSEAAATAMLTASSTLLRQSVDSIIDLQSSLGVREERMAASQARYVAEGTSLGIALNGVVGRDQAEAASEMRQLESQLEAAYLTTSRMANLTLTNFLR